MRLFKTATRIAAACLGLHLLHSAPASADAVQDFYRGKQIVFLVGSDPGGGYDLLARLVARHLGRFIPGNPNVIVENMPGAGSILLSNRLYNSAPADGTYIGLVQRGVLLAPLTHQPNVRFDLTKFRWIGSITSEEALTAVWHTSSVMSFRDLQSRDVIVGGTGPTSDTEASARLLNAVAGTRFKIVSGYPGTSDVMLAMQRGELEGIADISWSELQSKDAALLQSKSLRFVLRHTAGEIADLPGIPNVAEFIKKPSDQQVANLYYEMKGVARPIMIGPAVPMDRVLAVQAAFESMIADDGFKQDAAKAALTLHPKTHDALETFIADTNSATEQIRQRMTEILNPPK